LLSNANGVAAGGLTAESQRLGSAIAGITYGNGNFNLGTGFQRVATATGKQLPVAYDENSYVEYRMAVPVGKKFQLKNINFYALGGGSGNGKMIVRYSLNDFLESDYAGTI